jgi:hypothetical protein
LLKIILLFLIVLLLIEGVEEKEGVKIFFKLDVVEF